MQSSTAYSVGSFVHVVSGFAHVFCCKTVASYHERWVNGIETERDQIWSRTCRWSVSIKKKDMQMDTGVGY